MDGKIFVQTWNLPSNFSHVDTFPSTTKHLGKNNLDMGFTHFVNGVKIFLSKPKKEQL